MLELVGDGCSLMVPANYSPNLAPQNLQSPWPKRTGPNCLALFQGERMNKEVFRWKISVDLFELFPNLLLNWASHPHWLCSETTSITLHISSGLWRLTAPPSTHKNKSDSAPFTCRLPSCVLWQEKNQVWLNGIYFSYPDVGSSTVYPPVTNQKAHFSLLGRGL